MRGLLVDVILFMVMAVALPLELTFMTADLSLALQSYLEPLPLLAQQIVP